MAMKKSPKRDDVKAGVVGGIGLLGFGGLTQLDLEKPGSIYLDYAEVAQNVFALGATASGVTLGAATGLYFWHGSRTFERRTTFHADGWANMHDYRDYLSASVISSNRNRNGNLGMGLIVRPSLAERSDRNGYKPRPTDYGVRLGTIQTGENRRIRRRIAYNGFERACLAIGPPGAGKTALLGHWVIDAPGAVLTATTKTDVYNKTSEIRAKRGPVLLFNPQGLGDLASTFAWDPVVGCEHYKVATMRARALVHGTKAITAMQEASWGEKCVEILSKYLMAARLAGGDLSTVAYWLADANNEEPLTVLRDERWSQYVPPGWANSLQAEMRSSADRMKGSIWSLAQSSVAFMSDPAVARACAKSSGSNFDVREFIHARGTLYLIGSDKDDMIAPLLSALTNYIYDTATEMAAEAPHQRLDPTFSLVLDEAAKITPVDLPGWGATARSAGIWLCAAVQTFDQLRERWGDRGAGTIETVFGTLLVLAGIKHDGDLTKISNLVGYRTEYEPPPNPKLSPTSREVRIMPQAQIRMLPQQMALVITGGSRAFVVKYERAQTRADRMIARIKRGKEPERGYCDSNRLFGASMDEEQELVA
ncbi:type IV secretory system conjugative DNA transfer family protein [Amycolatopsis thailandensis]|uniref:type IV secretory system conjugative DNA transfer family protein n=1 Tax=Amycolatopsis thailandensis TaxID=589330 RepID=UPI003642100E